MRSEDTLGFRNGHGMLSGLVSLRVSLGNKHELWSSIEPSRRLAELRQKSWAI